MAGEVKQPSKPTVEGSEAAQRRDESSRILRLNPSGPRDARYIVRRLLETSTYPLKVIADYSDKLEMDVDREFQKLEDLIMGHVWLKAALLKCDRELRAVTFSTGSSVRFMR